MARDSEEPLRVAVGLAACFVAAGLYRMFGFLGVSMLGLFILSAALRLELEDGHGVGADDVPNLYAQQVQVAERFSRAERAAWRGEQARRRMALRYAQMLGLAILMVGGCGFAFVDLRLAV